ncbi:meiotic cell cortex C-terminal pleckstrin homology-domain-containing protein [Clohesyomyces aquaticus]|uniref:Meiotic cell cortex C-terminal pleckstrin homology-domain-containing protein n=1 Tax=Clohesyomyces aquaticus TaxID=1231657 RepID=A0A1Y1ZU10_9PLEO|nr:meiotic cell cortex C-terminal pleckstrin homology-domain-containing protein [Clohesyomyces aquaticus]
MSTDYFSDIDAYSTNHPLPSPADTPYHSLSRRTSRYGTPATDVPSSPVPFPPDPADGYDSTAQDENISVLDPRRFTPTLHANLVSEILSLRRELDSKHKFIEDLETNYQTVRTENENLNSQLSSSTKESRAVKRQLQQLENGTLSALEEIAGERDKTKEANVDLRQRLEATQKKLKAQEEDSTRVHDMWAREKEIWAGEKRSLERRVHVSDSRLKMLLDELAMQEEAQEEAGLDSEGEDNTRDSGVGHESDTGSIRSSPQRRPSTRLARHSRNRSNGSYRSMTRGYRMSLMSEGQGRSNGLSLADELTFDEEEEDLGDLELDSDDFPENEMRARRALESRQSMRQDDKAKRILGLSVENDPVLFNQDAVPEEEEAEAAKTNGSTRRSSTTVRPREVTLIFPPPKPHYVDTGVQPSPPPSPVQVESSAPPAKSGDMPSIAEIEANQSRKRVSATTSTASLILQNNAGAAARVMTSTSSQTIEQPLSPPATPKIVIPVPETPVSPVFKPDVASASTQTEPLEEPKAISPPPPPKRAPPPVPIPIPSIAIHAPTSAPPSPREPILPPGTKTVATQTGTDLLLNTRSTSMQTEPIRVDQRPVKLPPHLLPSAISSKPGTPEPVRERSTGGEMRKDSHQAMSISSEKPATAGPTARQDLIALLEKAAEKKTERRVEDRYPGNNDNGPLALDKEIGISRPFRTSSLFAGFDGPSSDEEDQNAEMSDDDYRPTNYSTPMLSSRNVKNGRVFNNPPTPVPEDKEVVSTSRPSEDSVGSSRILSSGRNSLERSAKVGKPLRSSHSLSRQPSIRRSAMIQSGTVAHHRSRSPSLGSVTSSHAFIPKPPFPVPTRSSSRNKPFSKSEGSQSPTPRGNGAMNGRRPYGTRPYQHQRKDSLRKVRSAAVIHKSSRSRSRSPPLPETPVLPSSPPLPPLPNDMVSGQRFGHQPQLSTTTSYTASGSVGSAAQQASVVDAIAATMVGEWMWKYVRKRKTFGGPETAADINREEQAAAMTSNGVRHKRWVWISPYERSVLWSSKQPTSGTALMGKSGRKLTIQSVLDVADSTPIPRNAGTETLFNRSILILTPARALKFTAVTRERHYLWLTALSFLAHSSSPLPDLGPVVPQAPPLPADDLPLRNGATLRKTHVRDSVRLAKDKANPVTLRNPPASNDPIQDWYARSQFDKPVPDAADPPSIPRGPYHGRKRSSTGPRVPPPSMGYRSFSHQPVPSFYSSGSSDIHGQPPSVPSSVYNPHSVITSGRTSEASTSTRRHFFDSMGTVRMEAFIENSLNEDPNQAGSAPGPRPRVGRRRGNSQWSSSTNDAHRGGGIYEDFMHESHDPFRGF